MRKVIAYIALSIDGFIADKAGGVDWLCGDGSDPQNLGSYDEFFDSIDTVIMGYATYNQIVTQLSPDFWVYTGKNSYVITHRQLENNGEITFTDAKLDELIGTLKSQEGKDIWICGGASVVAQLIRLELIDEFVLSVIPVILGDGIRLFDKQKGDLKLKLKSTKSYNGIVDLCYERRG